MKPSILIVEDERLVAEDIRRSLQMMDYGVIGICSSGEDALEKIRESTPDLVLMDIVLRGEMDGITTVERIRQMFNIPVIYLTAYADRQTLQKAKITEPFGYILKPFDDRELHSTIEMALYKHSMEKRLRESEAWFSTTLRSVGESLIATDCTGCIKLMNPAARRLTGWDDAAVGRPLDEVLRVIDAHTRRPVELPVDRILKEGKTASGMDPVLLVAMNFRKIPIEMSMAPIQDDRGVILGVVIVFKDISNRKRAEEALRESESRLKTVLDYIPEGVLIIDANTHTIVDANPAAVELIGVSKDHIIASSRSELLDEKDETVSSVSGHTDHINSEEILRRADGRSIPVLKTVVPIVLDGRPHLLESLTDITRRKEVESALQRQNVHLDSLNMISRDLAGTLELKVILRTALKEVLKIGSYTAGAIIFNSDEEQPARLKVQRGVERALQKRLVTVHEDSQVYQKAMDRGETTIFNIVDILDTKPEQDTGQWNGTTHCLAIPIRAGKQVLGSVNLFGGESVMPAEKEFGFYSSIGVHIGLAVRNARLYEKANRALEALKITQDKLVQSEKLAGLGFLAGKIVHEIGNPLAAISNSIQVLQERVHLEGRMKELMDIIGSETERLGRAIEQLREFSRPRKLMLRSCDLSDVVKRAVMVINQDFELIWGKKLKKAIPQTFPEVELDSDAMEQVALNLLKNGFQAVTEGGTVEVKLSTQGRNPNKNILFQVVDDGPGIPESDLERIFEPYYSNKARGMGLGMHIVKQIVEAHGGKITLKSQPGEGTSVNVEIPVKRG